MKNNKGFTVVELIASFSLTMIISVFLFEVLIDVKDIFVETTIKTSIQEKMGVISKNIKYNLPPVGSKVTCNDASTCFLTNNKNGVNESNINVIIQEESVTISNQKFDMPKTVKVDLNRSSLSVGNNCYLKLNLVLNSPNLSKPYNYSAVFYFSTYS